MSRILLVILALLLVPIAISAAGHWQRGTTHWSQTRWDSAGLAPDPATTPEAVVQVYAADAWGWKGIFGVHTWVALKPENAPAFERYDVAGWGVSRGRPAIRRNMRPVDGYWAGNPPEIVAELRGPEAAAAIDKIRAAVASYPYPDRYRAWPGPNSNTFTASILRAVPELHAALPAKAIGKDYPQGASPLARAPSGTGFQFSLLGLFGVTLAAVEGIEVNILGLTVGIDLARPALKLPGIGRLGLP